jgi:two-component system chemotaxis response regulator CheB
LIRVLAVDDSALMRRVLAHIFASEPDIEVTFARDGVEALALLPTLRPHVVTLDVQMPRMDGLTCLEHIMAEHPCPVVMLSSLTREGADATLQALHMGAVDFLPKPDGTVSLAVDDLAPVLLAKVRAAAEARLHRVHRSDELARRALPAHSSGSSPAREAEPGGVVLVGVSTGGPPALEALLGGLPPDLPWAIVVAQHMPAGFTASLAERLDRLCALDVREVTGPTPLAPGAVYIGRGDADLLISQRAAGLVAIPAPSSPDYRWHPSVDRLVASAQGALPPERLIGVLLTGMGHDGARAMTALRTAGGRTIAEAESTAVVWGMPRELVRLDGADAVLPLDEIGPQLTAWVSA